MSLVPESDIANPVIALLVSFKRNVEKCYCQHQAKTDRSKASPKRSTVHNCRKKHNGIARQSKSRLETDAISSRTGDRVTTAPSQREGIAMANSNVRNEKSHFDPSVRLSVITATITEPERKSLLQLARASPASRASYCYSARSGKRPCQHE